MKPDLYTKVILTAIAACLAFLAYKVGTSPFFAQPKVEATQPAAIEATPKPIEVVPAEQSQAPAPKVELPAPPPPPPEPPPPPVKAALAPQKPEPPQVIVPRPRVARLDIVEKQVQEKKLADAETERKLQEEDAVAKAEQQRKQKESDAAAALAEQERKQAEKLAQEAEAGRKQKEKDEAEAVRKLKEEKEVAAARAEQDKKQAEAEAARKQKEKEEAVRNRQRKESEDRIKKMAKDAEIKEQTEDVKRRIVQKVDAELRASEPDSKLAAKTSDNYAASIQAAIKPNITFDPNSISGNPAVEILVGLGVNGAIRSRTVIRSSGVAAWDAAAVTALDKTESLPLDEKGRVPPTLIITLRPRER